MEALGYFTFRRQRAKGDAAVKGVFSMPIRGETPAAGGAGPSPWARCFG
jgi:hypothetical protein